MMNDIPAFCLDWHINVSSAFRDLLIESLKPYASIQLQCWDGKIFPLDVEDVVRKSAPIIFCQLPPPLALLSACPEKIIWLPMWDHACGYPDSWWQSLPKDLRIVAFSDQIAAKSKLAGIKYLHLKYYLDPEKFLPVNNHGQRVLFYWNRVGFLPSQVLIKICNTLHIDTLLFRDKVDPFYPPDAKFDLPSRVGRTRVITCNQTMTQEEYMRFVSQANICIAPRLKEGVGLVFLEMMAQGCTVFAYDAPTMNEYINHLENGYLLKHHGNSLAAKSSIRIHTAWFKYSNRIRSYLGKKPKKSKDTPVTSYQDWKDIAHLDLSKLGSKAREDHFDGYLHWRASIQEYADFILKGPTY